MADNLMQWYTQSKGLFARINTLEAEKKELTRKEEEPRPLTDEEFKEYREKDARTTKKVKGFFKAIWEAINFFS